MANRRHQQLGSRERVETLEHRTTVTMARELASTTRNQASIVTKGSTSCENHAALSKLKPRSSRSMGTSIRLEPSASSDQVVKRLRSPIPLPSIGARNSWKKGGLRSLETRKLEDSGKWRPSNSMDQGVKSSKRLRSPIPFLSVGVKVSWKTGRLHTLKTRKLGNGGNWRSSRSIDQGAKGPKRPQSPTWLLSLGTKDSWETR
jgi:hypothetical protein